MSKVTKKTIAHKTTKRPTKKLDPRLQEIFQTIVDKSRTADYHDFTEALWQQIEWRKVPASIVMDMVKTLFTGEDFEKIEYLGERRAELTKFSRSEHLASCICCRDKAGAA